MNEIYKKQCPECNRDMVYTGKYAKVELNRSMKKNKICLSCACSGERNGFYGKKLDEIVIEKLRKINIGKKHANETKLKMSADRIGNKNAFYGKKHSEETKKIISSKRKGQYSGECHYQYGKPLNELQKMKLDRKGKHLTEQQRIAHSLRIRGKNNPNYGKKFSEEIKRKFRAGQLKRLQKLGIPSCIDAGATEWFEKYNKENNTNYKPKRFIEVGYDADGYDEQLHSWIEYDTDYHKRILQKEKDLIRQNNIINYFKEIGKPLNSFMRVLAYNNEEIKVI